MVGQLNEKAITPISSIGADIVTPMDTIQWESATIVPIAFDIQKDTMGQPMATIRLQLALTGREVARIISPCEKGRGQTVCYM